MSCLVLSCLVLSCLVLSYLVLRCFVLSCLVLSLTCRTFVLHLLGLGLWSIGHGDDLDVGVGVSLGSWV